MIDILLFVMSVMLHSTQSYPGIVGPRAPLGNPSTA